MRKYRSVIIWIVLGVFNAYFVFRDFLLSELTWVTGMGIAAVVIAVWFVHSELKEARK